MNQSVPTINLDTASFRVNVIIEMKTRCVRNQIVIYPHVSTGTQGFVNTMGSTITANLDNTVNICMSLAEVFM